MPEKDSRQREQIDEKSYEEKDGHLLTKKIHTNRQECLNTIYTNVPIEIEVDKDRNVKWVGKRRI